MTGLITKHNHFSFRIGELPMQLAEKLQVEQIGYWRYRFDRLVQVQPSFYWYCGVAHGKLLYSGSSTWSSINLLRLLQRYSTNIRKEEFQPRLNRLKTLAQQQEISPIELSHQLQQEGIVTPEQIQQCLHTKILSDCDQYFAFSDGQAEFVADHQLAITIPGKGFDLQNILTQAEIRSAEWTKIKSAVPSLELIPTLHPNIPPGKFSADQHMKVAQILHDGNNINKIAINLAKDNIDVAKMFTKLVKAGMVVLKNPLTNHVPKVMVVDDSPLMLKQFQHWLKALNYPILLCQDAIHATSMIQENRPDIIFIDINMPIISGFELVKKIRLIPEISNIPIVILTGEQKLSNKWRAQWGGCEFLTKPITANEQKNFPNILQQTIPRLLENMDNIPSQSHLSS